MTVIIGHRKGMVHGPHLYNAAGQIIASDASGHTVIVAAPTIANQPLVASSGLLPSWGQPNGTSFVAADVTHTQSNTTLSDITGLLVPIGASATEIWFWEAYLLVVAANTAVDSKFGFTVPTSATMKWNSGFTAVGAAATPGAVATQTDTILSGLGAVTQALAFAGWIFGGGTAGNVQFQFAQNTSSASDLTVQKGSMLRYRRLVA